MTADWAISQASTGPVREHGQDTRDNAELLTVVQHLDQQHRRHLAPHPGRLLALTRGDTSRLPGLDSRS